MVENQSLRMVSTAEPIWKIKALEGVCVAEPMWWKIGALEGWGGSGADMVENKSLIGVGAAEPI